MATTKITDLTAYTDPVNTDVLPIVDVTSDVTKKVSIANVMKNASQGTAAAPGIAFDGDSNTGIYSPGANQVAITTDGTQRLLIDSAGAVTIAGDLTVNGTTTNINTQNLIVEDKNVVLGDVAVPTDVTADGGGITLKGTTDKTINWVDSTDAWTSSERFSYPTGSAAAPTLTFTGDPNTGIYSPGADQVAISTGGSGRLFVDASGNIGINVASPTQARLVVASSAGANTGYFTDGTNSTIKFLHGGGGAIITTESGQYLGLGTADTERLRITSAGLVGIGTSSPARPLEVNGAIRLADANRLEWGTSYYIVGDSGGAMTFATASAERVRIDSSGRLGVGTSSPVLPLTVAGAIAVGGAGNNGIQFYNASPTATALRWLIANNQGDSDKLSIYRYDSSGNFAGTPLVIDSSNRVGIGTSSPSSLLHVSGSNADIRLTDTNVTNATWRLLAQTGGSTKLFRIYDDSNAADRLVIDSSGRVGIGTTSPTNAKLVVTDGAQVTGAANDANATCVTVDYSSGVGRLMGHGSSGGQLAFFTNASGGGVSERARIDSSGRLLVGTSSGTGGREKLQVMGNTSDAAGSGEITLAKGSSVSSGDLVGVINFTSSTNQSFAAINAFADATTGTNDYPGRLVFSVTRDGASSPTERARISNAGSFGTFTADVSTIVCKYISSAAAAGTDQYFIIGAHSATGVYSGTTSFQVFTNGNVQNTNNSYAGISDIKLKENIVDANSQWNDIKALRPVNYNFKAETNQQTHTQLGLIAQEVEQVSPGLVSESPDRDAEGNDLGTTTKSVNYSVLYMKAVKALQEAMERIETLEASNTDLLARVSALESA